MSDSKWVVNPNKPKEEPKTVRQVAEEGKTFRPLFEQVDGWSYEVETLPESDKFMADGVTPRVMLRGILQRAETINQNKRVYPFAILKREVDNYQRFIQENRAFGELDHPDSSVVELKNVSHVIRETWWDGNDLYGKVEVLNTEAGKVVRELINAGTTIGISSRGVGSTRNEGGVDIVQEDFMLICWDFVSEPSTPGAFMFKEHREPNISRTIVESARSNWGLDCVNVFKEGLVQDEFSQNFCKSADEIISLFENFKNKE